MLTNHECAWLRLHLSAGIGRRGLFQLRETFGSPEAALRAPRRRWPQRIGSRLSETIRIADENGPAFRAARAALDSNNVRIISFWDDDYPDPLRSIHDPPALIYLRGSLGTDPGLAVVGSRRCSSAGRQITHSLSRQLVAHGFSIISGLARGIDSAAHCGALDAGGHTVAVLGCGIDVVYPRENARLYQRIGETGAILSEYPPGTEPKAGHFPGRNRIISGLSQGVLVVEAAEGSGSLITADFALEQGRDVFAIPGAISSFNSSGVNRLLKDGAHLVTGVQDILDVCRPGVGIAPKDAGAPAPENLTAQEKILLEHLADQAVQIDELVRKSGLTPMELSAILLQLELRGVVCQLPGMRYRRCFQAVGAGASQELR